MRLLVGEMQVDILHYGMENILFTLEILVMMTLILFTIISI